MKLYLYSLSDLVIFDDMLMKQLEEETSLEEQESIVYKLNKIHEEKKRRLSNVEFITANDESD